VLKIAKAQQIKPKVAIKIIDNAIKIVKTFEQKARALELDENTIEECRKDIDGQIELIEE